MMSVMNILPKWRCISAEQKNAHRFQNAGAKKRCGRHYIIRMKNIIKCYVDI